MTLPLLYPLAVSDASLDLSVLIELPPLKQDPANTGQLLIQTCVRHSTDTPGAVRQKTVALATFIPRLTASTAAAPAERELIFVVDGSGSMHGAPIRQALEAALFFVKDLPMPAEGGKGGSGATTGLSFNVVVFGSRHVSMWPASRPYDASSQSEAVQWLYDNVHANYGGTELLAALTTIYERMPLKAGRTRQIVLLTDGGVSGTEEQAIYDLLQGSRGSRAAKAAAARTTVFTLGIGHGVHRGLVEGMASRSGGVAQFVLGNEALRAKAGMLQRCALAVGSGCLVQPRLEAKGCVIRAAPHVLPPRAFPDEPLHVSAIAASVRWRVGHAFQGSTACQRSGSYSRIANGQVCCAAISRHISAGAVLQWQRFPMQVHTYLTNRLPCILCPTLAGVGGGGER